MKHPQLSSPLYLADKTLKVTRIQSLIALCLPIPMLILGIWLVNLIDGQYTWYEDPLLVLIMGFFAATQCMTTLQLFQISKSTLKSSKVIHTLQTTWKLGVDECLNALEKLPRSHLRDCVHLWIEHIQIGDLESFESLQDRQHDRRAEQVTKKMSFHIAMNRASLKIGFIGTLIGLLLTFEPMKDALITLKKDDGELGFISDIARAIDGDQYAILATLVASALSVAVETINMQWLERILARYEMMNNYVEEWSLMELVPWAQKQNAANNHHLLESQIEQLSQVTLKTQLEIQKLIEIQAQTSQRIEFLAEQEKQYQAFLRSRMGIGA